MTCTSSKEKVQIDVQHLVALTTHAQCNPQAGMEITKHGQSAKPETDLPALLADDRELINSLT
jgi:hypothetical protein